MKRTHTLLCVFCVLFANLYAQHPEGMTAGQHNYTSFSPLKKHADDEVLRFNPGHEQDPEIGQLFTDAPCEDCFEVIEKRTETTKYFLKKGTGGNYMYQQSSIEPMHIKDAHGNYTTVVSILQPDPAKPGLYTALNQPIPVGIHTGDRFSFLGKDQQRLYFNRNLVLVYVPDGGEEQVVGPADWTHYTAGDDGVYITDAWPGIDIEMWAARGQIKTNYIIKNQLPQFANGSLRIRDRLLTDPGLSIHALGENEFFGEIEVKDAAQNVLFLIEPALAFDKNGKQGGQSALNYEMNGQQLDIIIPQEWVNRDASVYPVVIDPVVSGTANMAISGSGYNATCFTGGCTYNLAVPVPAAITVTDIRWSFNYTATGLCYLSDGAVDFQLGACRSPNGAGYYWFCNLFGGGTCNGNNVSIITDLQSCVPAPSCASYNMNFTMHFYRCYSAGAGCSNACIGAASPWTMVVEGHTVEPTSLITVLPAVTICQGQSTTLTATGQYGVPGYTYTWNPGGLTGSPSVSPAANTNYTVTITDQCGNTTTATKQVNVTPSSNPGFTISPNPVCQGQTVTITGLGASPATSYDWTLPSSSNPTVNNTQSFNVTYPSSGTYPITLNFANGSCIFPLTQNITVNAPTIPTISISASPAGPYCPGSTITFTANITNGGSTPGYQWQVNGVNVGTNSSTFSSSSLNNGDVVTCILTSNAACVSPASVTSSPVNIVMSAALTPTINITAAPGNTICAGTNVTFTANITNGGSAPIYQWHVNGTNVGTNSSTFSSSSLNNGDVITCTLTSNDPCAITPNANSNSITMTVNPVVTPTISITAAPGSTICAGTNVTFTANITNGGSSPTYQWHVNGTNVGTNSNTFSSSSLNNGDVITCTLTSNAPCASPASVTSTSIVMTVNPVLVPTISISAAPGNTICSGTNVTFTANITNGGSAPTYQWHVNGTNVGTNSSTFSSSTLNNGDVITCTLTSNALCASPASVTSTTIVMTVTPTVVPTINIVAAPGNTICAGTNVTFTANITNGGSAPTYQWHVNGTNVGTNSNTYSSSALNNGDIITCTLTSNAPCATPASVTSASIIMTVNPVVTPTINITTLNNTICSGTNVTFTANITNGGSAPTYQWQVNGANVGSNSSTYSSSTLNNSDVITCTLTSNAPCANPVSAASNSITMIVTSTVVPTISISVSPAGPICAGDNVTFTANITNGGSAPTYQWHVNGTNVGTNSNTFSSSSLNNGDVVTCTLTSNAPCATPASLVSNSITMVVNPVVTPTINIVSNPGMPMCTGTNVTFTANITNGGSAPVYQWQVNGVNVGTNSNTYTSSTLVSGDVVTCSLTTSAPCATAPTANSNSITISTFPAATLGISPDQSICAGDPVTLTATPGSGNPSNYTIVWQPNNTSGTSISMHPPATATYTATVTDGCGSTASATVTVTVNPRPVASFTFNPNPTDLTQQPTHFTDASTGAVSWFWDFGNGNTSASQNPSFSYTAGGSYPVILMVTSANGCTDTTLTVLIFEEIYSLFIPSAFTPNDDALNPIFYAYGHGINTFRMEIFNRWGVSMFISEDMEKGWNGVLQNGTLAEQGAYSYRVEVEFTNKKTQTLMGKLTLIR